MKLTQEELKRFDAIKRGTNNLHETWKDLPFLIHCIEKLIPQSRDRFTYEYLQCGKCSGTGSAGNGVRCRLCKGLGKKRNKIKAGNP